MMNKYAVVDLFAGPGGLAEGFSSIRDDNGKEVFNVELSVEWDPVAHGTLLLRTFLRKFPSGLPREYYDYLNHEQPEPDWSALYPEQWEAAKREALNLELGADATTELLNPRLDTIRENHDGRVILIGGPPCQAYSLVGRARNKGIVGYSPENDSRHFLYREYIRILDRLRPAAFVMENVKGMLSSRVHGESVFERVLDDLEGIGGGLDSYRLIPLAPRSSGVRPGKAYSRADDFVVRAEDAGLPQARHRVIIVGIRGDVLNHDSCLAVSRILEAASQARLDDVLSEMPRLRSGLSRTEDSHQRWVTAVCDAADTIATLNFGLDETRTRAFHARAREVSIQLRNMSAQMTRNGSRPAAIGKSCPRELAEWLLDPRLEVLPNNETRGHMTADLGRYLFAAIFGEVFGRSPKASDFPDELAPSHRNWKEGKFSDRFRVQLRDQHSSTITSHISKDGHYFIHPDPLQCRSLTVREAARLQTFPDNYLFKGNRTQQYVQVGNAVPPFLARKIAMCILELLGHSESCRADHGESLSNQPLRMEARGG